MGPAEGGVGGFCSFDSHENCDHQRAASLRLFGRGERNFVLLCHCPCHDACPLHGCDEVSYPVWDRDCVCPGAPRTRERRARIEREATARQQLDSEVVRDVEIGQGKTADQIQAEILAAYRTHDVEPRSDFSRVARFLAAGSARPGTRTPRLLWELGSGVRALRRWADEHAADGGEAGDLADVEASDENRRERCRLQASLAGLTALAIAAAGAGWKTTGLARLLLALAAVLLAALSAWIGLFARAIALLDRLSGAGRRRSTLGERAT